MSRLVRLDQFVEVEGLDDKDTDTVINSVFDVFVSALEAKGWTTGGMIAEVHPDTGEALTPEELAALPQPENDLPRGVGVFADDVPSK